MEIGKQNIKGSMLGLEAFLDLKGRTNRIYPYFSSILFPNQMENSIEPHVFKISTIRLGSGVDLVQRMQPDGDLCNAWLMFDHVKRVKGWTTMACHMYDASYCHVMTIAVCDMQSEDVQTQLLFWKNLNAVASCYGVHNSKFKGFMADSA